MRWDSRIAAPPGFGRGLLHGALMPLAWPTLLAGIRAAKIQGTARPGETVRLEATVSGRMGGLVQVTGSASVDGRPVLRCELTLAGDVV